MWPDFSTISVGSILLVLLIFGTVLVVIGSNADPGKKVSWLLVIALLPVVGIILYLLVGLDIRNAKFYARKTKKFSDFVDDHTDDRIKKMLFDRSTENKIKPEYRELSRLLSRSNGTTVCDNNDIEIITSGQRKFEALCEDLKNAKHHIHMEYFYFRKDEGSKKIKEILMQKAREGVKVRFIHENIANILISPRYYNEMKEAGVEVVKFIDAKFSLVRWGMQLNYRDHRKVVIIDGKIGYTGGMNISDDYFLRWRDTHLRLTGNSVAKLQYSFMTSYITSGGIIEDDLTPYFPEQPAVEENDCLVQIVPDEPDLRWPIYHMGACWVAQHARNYLYVQTPYFVPPEPLLQALKITALKGTDVRLMLPYKADLFFMGPPNCSYFQECLEAGVKIYRKKGNFIHAKTLVSDNYLSIVGSSNWDHRSIDLSYELNAYLFGEKIGKMNKEIFLKDQEECVEVNLEEWKHRPWYQRFAQAIAKLFSPIL